jgi:hypothetical protein
MSYIFLYGDYVTEEQVRLGEDDLLNTDAITSEFIVMKIDDAVKTVFNRLGVEYDTPIPFSKCTEDIILAMKQMAQGDIICSKYTANEIAMKRGEQLLAKAEKNLNAIVTGRKRLKEATKQTTEAIHPNKFRSYSDSSRSEDFITKMNERYR